MDKAKSGGIEAKGNEGKGNSGRGMEGKWKWEEHNLRGKNRRGKNGRGIVAGIKGKRGRTELCLPAVHKTAVESCAISTTMARNNLQ